MPGVTALLLSVVVGTVATAAGPAAHDHSAATGHRPGPGCGVDMSGPYPVPRGFAKETVSIECSDGYQLAADLLKRTHRKSERRFPAVVFLHDDGKERHMWHAQSLFSAQRLFVSLSPDLRGYGENPGTVGNPGKTASGFTDAEWKLMPEDVHNAASSLAVKPDVDGGKLALVGCGMGANLALLAAGSSWAEAVRVVIAVSPALEWKGMSVKDAVARIPRGTRVYLAAAKDDPAGFAACEELMGLIRGPKEFFQAEKGGPGLLLFQGPDFHKITRWLFESLHEPPAADAKDAKPARKAAPRPAR